MSNAVKIKYKDHNNYILIGTNDVLYVEQASATVMKIWYNVFSEAAGKVMMNEVEFGVNVTAADVKALQNLIKEHWIEEVPFFKSIIDQELNSE